MSIVISQRIVLQLFAGAFAALTLVNYARTAEPTIANARSLYLRGNYAEAQEAYSRLAEKEPVAAAVGQARCLTAVGKSDEAAKLLTAAAKKNDAAGEIHSELAILAVERGDYKAAEREAQAAIDL